MSGGDIRTARQARQVLGLADTAGVEDLRRAYRRAVRAAHPDHGGDAERLRQVIDAHRILTTLNEARLSLPPSTHVRPPAPPRPIALSLTAAEALAGTAKKVRLHDGRVGRLKLPAGLTDGATVRLKLAERTFLFAIAVAPPVSAHDKLRRFAAAWAA